jgi:hypothetical protein
MAAIQADRHAYREAEDLYSRALANGEKTLGPEHPDLAAMSSNPAHIYSFQGRYGDAEKSYARALGIWERSLGAAHPDVAGCLLNYAAVLRKVRRRKEAGQLEARARQSIAMHDRDNPESPPGRLARARAPVNNPELPGTLSSHPNKCSQPGGLA